MAEIWYAEDKARKAFGAAYGAKFAKAAVKFTDDQDELLAGERVLTLVVWPC